MSRIDPPPYNPADDEFDMIEAARDEVAINRYLDRWEDIEQ